MLSLQDYKGTERIFAHFDFDAALVKLVRQVAGSRYSGTKKCWHIPVVKELVIELANKTKDVAVLELTLLRQQLLERKSVQCIKEGHVNKPDLRELSEKNSEALDKYVELLILKQYSNSTLRTYRSEFFQLLKEIRQVHVDTLTIDDIKRYMRYCFVKHKISEATANSRINAIKFYYESVLGRAKMFIELPRPKKPIKLPNVLGEMEVGRLFRAVQNLKHKAILFTAYSAGLRVSEVVTLQLNHIDSDRMQILVKCAKGKKDRYVSLSPLVLDVLRSYLLKSRQRPVKYVFEGITPGICYSIRSAEEIFNKAKAIAQINKDITFHGLRHSFATHLLEKGIDVKYIQELLGHFNIKTTMRYLHVRRESLVNIGSPIDDLYKKGIIK